MTSTNRVANRVFLLMIGALLMVAGGAAVALSVLPGSARLWRSRTVDWRSAVGRAQEFGAASIGIDHPVPWFLFAVPAAAAIVIAVILLFVFAQGRGRLARVADGWHVADSPAEGFLSVDVGVAREVIRRAVGELHGAASPTVSAYRVIGEPVLKVAAAVVDGVDPVTVIPVIETAIARWDALLGERCPVYLQLSAGPGASVRAPLRVAVGRRREPSSVE